MIVFKNNRLNLFRYFKYKVLQKKNMQSYAKIGHIDHNKLHNIFITISVMMFLVNPSKYKLFILIFNSSYKMEIFKKNCNYCAF